MNTSKPSILVVDDEPQIRKMLSITLTANDFKVEEAENGNEALRLSASRKPELVILDLGLPDMDGTEVIKKLREWSDVPIIVLSVRDDDSVIVEAFELGADDYVVKPFSMDILIARIKAAMRFRIKEDVGDTTLEVGNIAVDLMRHEVTKNNEVLELSPKEYNLLAYFIRHKGKMLTHRQILKEVWGEAHTHDKQYLRVYIGQLRQKIEPNPDSPSYIVTEAGIGYRLDDQVD
jgi:two-component system KDP operon response regulator KdpE